MTQTNNPPTILYLENKKMEEKIKLLQDRVSILEKRELSQSKKPHKCPICNGHGSVVISKNECEPCHVCEGKSIVWG